ncbi:PrsW family glutamic-type intramembrane protease [Gemmatimonadota bacterium]
MSRRRTGKEDSLSHEPALSPSAGGSSEREKIEHSVWEEPHLAHLHRGRVTPFSRLYAERVESTTPLKSWGIALSAGVIGGPLAIIGAFLYGAGPLGPFVWGPTAEEVLKIAVIAMIVETRPYLLRHGYQIITAAAVSALIFAAIENLLYLRIYIPEASGILAAWRWNFGSLLHVSASMIASLGLVKIWRESQSDFTRPQFSGSLPYLIGAIILHGGYNLAVTIWERGWNPFP